MGYSRSDFAGLIQAASRQAYTGFIHSQYDLPSFKPLLPCIRSHGTRFRTCMCASRQGNCLGSSSNGLALPRGSHAPSNAECSQVEQPCQPHGHLPHRGKAPAARRWCHELWLCLSWAEESMCRCRSHWANAEMFAARTFGNRRRRYGRRANGNMGVAGDMDRTRL